MEGEIRDKYPGKGAFPHVMRDAYKKYYERILRS